MADLPKKSSKSAIAIAFAMGAGTGAGGQQLAVDSPVHLSTVNVEPAAPAEEWVCAPEGGIVGAVVVCAFTSKAREPQPMDVADAGQ